MRKKLEDMNLLDNFLFGSVVTYPVIGEEFTRKLLKIIFGREFKRLSVYPQRVFYEVTIKYMRLMEDEWILINRGRRFGREEGETCKLISQIYKKMQRNKTLKEIAEELEEEITVVEPIYKEVKESGESYDCEQIYEKLTGKSKEEY